VHVIPVECRSTYTYSLSGQLLKNSTSGTDGPQTGAVSEVSFAPHLETTVALDYFGCNTCAIITWRLKFSAMLSSRRTSVGFFASDMRSILSCSFSSA
jgi:hypothetical protein